MKEFFDDKITVILAVLVLGLGLIIKGVVDPETSKLLMSVFTGLFGIAVGRVSK